MGQHGIVLDFAHNKIMFHHFCKSTIKDKLD
jgi:hypothetical protein